MPSPIQTLVIVNYLALYRRKVNITMPLFVSWQFKKVINVYNTN